MPDTLCNQVLHQGVQKPKCLTGASIYQVIRYTVRGKFLVCAGFQRVWGLKPESQKMANFDSTWVNRNFKQIFVF